MPTETSPSLKVSTGWIELEVVAEVDVVLTYKGYAPVLHVQKLNNELGYILYISARSLGQPLEALRQSNNGLFKGLRFRVRKESADQMSKYEVEEIK